MASFSDTEAVFCDHERHVESILPAVMSQLEEVGPAKLILRSASPRKTGAAPALGRLSSTLTEQKRSEQSKSRITSDFS